MAITNQDVASVFHEMADLLRIRGGDPHRARAFQRAGEAIQNLPEGVESMIRDRTLQRTPGIGEGTVHRIKQILMRGTCDDQVRLRQSMPANLRELLRLRGVGPVTVRRLHQELGIVSVDQLEVAAHSGALLRLPRFGPDGVHNVLRAIEVYRRLSSTLPLARAERIAGDVAQELAALPEVSRAVVAGSCRRRKAEIGDLDVVVCSPNAGPVVQALASLPGVEEVLSSRDDGASVRLTSLRQLDLRVVPPSRWGAGLHHFTGSRQHNIELRTRASRRGLHLSERGLFTRDRQPVVSCRSEEEVFASLGLVFIPPELREGLGEVEAAAAGRLPRLIEAGDLRGDLHMHTIDSDGSATASDMAAAAIGLGYEYVAITDHSRSLAVANGLDERRLSDQVRRLRRLQDSQGRLHILAGIEVDILEDGRLDLPPTALQPLDWVIGSVHDHHDMPAAEMTHRIVSAISSGLIDCVGHLNGRRLGEREPSALDRDRILDAARRYGVALEINGNPLRMDIDDVTCRAAREAGVMAVVTTDAHAPAHLPRREYALAMARRGWLQPGDVLNTRSLCDLRAWRDERRRRGGVAVTVRRSASRLPATPENPHEVDDELVAALGSRPLAPDLRLRLEKFLRDGDDADLEAALSRLGDVPVQQAFNLLATAGDAGAS
jgi:DNA polymerase (family 10)